MSEEQPQAGTLPVSAETPFVGLVPYREEDAAFFFGRDEETRIVAGNLRASGLTLFYGASGVGKTSLLRAGVIHDLHSWAWANASRARRRRAPFAICIFSSWRDDPLAALLETIRQAGEDALGGEGLPAWEPGEPVDATLRAWTERVRTFLVVLDQFEDYFLYHPEEDGPGTFAGELPAVVNDPNLRVNFLLSIREDALAKLDRFKGRIPRLFANYVRIEHLSRAAATEAVEGPVREWNRRLPQGEEPYVVEPALVETVVEAAATGGLTLTPNGSRPSATDDREHVEAPFLQLVMERLWRETVATGSRELTLAQLERLGGASRIVENHLLEALAGLGGEERETAADLFRFLVTRSKTKIAHPASDLAEWTGRPEAEVTAILETLCRGESGRILRRVPPPPTANGSSRYELFHDVLAEPILEWRRAHEEECRRRAARRRFLRIGGGLLLLAAVLGTLGIWALVQRSEAREASRTASSLALAAAARAQLGDNVDRSLLLGLEAYRESPSTEAASVLVDALAGARRSGAETILRSGRPEGVRTIAFSPDGTTLAVTTFPGWIELWDTKAGRKIENALFGHDGEVWGLAFSPVGDILASSGHDGTVRLWDVESRRAVREPLDPDIGAIRAVTFSPDGKTLALAGSDDTVRLVDAETGRPVSAPLRGHRSEVVSVAFSPDGGTLASAGYDRTVRLWDLRTRRAPRVLAGHEEEIWTVAFSADGRTVASAGRDGTVRLWDARTGRTLGDPLDADAGQIWTVAFSPNGRTLAASAFDDTVRLWDVPSGRPAGFPLRGHSEGVIGIAFRSDGVLASSSYDGTIRLWNPSGRAPLGSPLIGHRDRVTSVAVSPDGRFLASGGWDRTIRLWDATSGEDVRTLEAPDAVESVAFSPDGKTLASGSGDGVIALWRIPDGGRLGELRGHEGAVQEVAFSPDGDVLASAGFDGTVRLWDLDRLRQLGEPVARFDEPVWSVAFSPDGDEVGFVSPEGDIHVRDVRGDGERVHPAGAPVLAVAFAPDGKTFADGSVGGEAALWDVPELTLVAALRGHRDRVESIAFAPDGRTLATASDDGTVRLWDVRARSPLGAPLTGHAGQVLTVAFAPDGLTLFSGGADRTVRAWDGILWRNLEDLERKVCGLVVGNLSIVEWDDLVPGLPYRETCPT